MRVGSWLGCVLAVMLLCGEGWAQSEVDTLAERARAFDARSLIRLAELDSGPAVVAISASIQEAEERLVDLRRRLREQDRHSYGVARDPWDSRLEKRERLAEKVDAALWTIVHAPALLQRMRSKSAMAEIVRQTKRGTPLCRYAHVLALDHPSRRSSVPLLLKLTQSRDARLKLGAMHALRHFRALPDVESTFRKLAKSRAPIVVRSAEIALGIRPPPHNYVLARTASEAERVLY